jgi:hypothetical protein
MSNLQLIEALCALVEMQSGIIKELAETMEQARCLSEAERAGIEAAREEYTRILGAGEWPDNL